MVTPLEILNSRIKARAGTDLVKGEVWLGRDLFQGSKNDTPDSHLDLADQLNHALVCLPVMDAQRLKPDLGYTYFRPADLEQTARIWDGPVLGVIDGPFQEMVNTLGLIKVLTLWGRDRQALESHYRTLAKTVLDLAARIADLPVAGVVITDDLAADSGPMVRPAEIDALCTPFYSKLVSVLKEKQKAFLFHSCGNLAALTPVIQSWKPDGFAAIQSRINTFDTLFTDFGSDIIILGGIEADHLQSHGMGPKTVDRLRETLRDPAGSPLVLGTSCGLFQADFLDRIQTIYQKIASPNLLLPGQ